jgi:Tol biopolymer transport system component
MTVAAGSRLGPYEILSRIGAGGMGEVWKGRDTRLERSVAIKVLSRNLAASPEVRQRFEREAKTISQLSHPHVCALHDVGREGEVDYLVMELLEGETLGERLVRGPLPLEQTLRYGAQIADALDKAHRQGIVHRDLKPGNVMLTKTGVKLLDFGLARSAPGSAAAGSLTASPTQANLTQEGTILGTFQYMAPEQLEGRAADARTDIFALGVTLYEMATGRKAFSGATQASLVSSILRDEPAPISQAQPTSPPALDRVIRACVAKDPEDRWQSAGDVGKELRWLADGSAAAMEVPTPGTARRARLRALPWAVTALLLLGLLYLGNDLRRARVARPGTTHSFILPPEKTTWRLTGDDAAPVAVSPDGDLLTYGAGGRLWVQSLSTGATTPLAGTEGARSPFWSPDGRSIGFFSESKLRRVDASGGPVTTICDAANSRGGSWSRSGVIAFTPDIRAPILQVPAAGGTPQPTTRIDAKVHTSHRWPYFLPDGRHFLYLAVNHNAPRSEQSGVYLGSLDGGEDRRLVSTYGGAQYASGWLLYGSDTSLMALRLGGDYKASGEPVRVLTDVQYDSGVWRSNFSVSQTGVMTYQVAQAGVGGQLTWLDANGRPTGTVGEKSEAYSPEISPDGRRAAVVLGDPANDIYVYELDRGIRTRLTTGAVVTPAPLWSPDGREILFTAQAQGGTFDICIVPADGSGKYREIYRSTERAEPSSWSRDGRYVLFNRGNIGTTDVWVMPLADPTKASAFVATPAFDTNGQFSPDGRWVAYRSSESGRQEIYVTPFPGGGAKWQVSSAGGTQPRWSADGRVIYFVSGDGELVAVPIEPAGDRLELRAAQTLFPANFYIGPRTGLIGYAVRPDGKGFLANSAGDVGVPRVALVQNWDAGLAK